jgi:hypothetical protein
VKSDRFISFLSSPTLLSPPVFSLFPVTHTRRRRAQARVPLAGQFRQPPAPRRPGMKPPSPPLPFPCSTRPKVDRRPSARPQLLAALIACPSRRRRLHSLLRRASTPRNDSRSFPATGYLHRFLHISFLLPPVSCVQGVCENASSRKKNACYI